MQSLDLQALEIFRAVAVEGGVSKAAKKLNRVQSNVSTRVRQLEEQVGKKLFLRQNRGVTLTADGLVLLNYADKLLQLSEEACEALQDNKPKGIFRIGTMESTAAARLPQILSRYHLHYPDVQIDLHTDTAGGLIERLLNYDIDIAFIAEPLSFEKLVSRPVFIERLVLVTPTSYPPLENVSEMSGKTIVAFEAGCAYRRYLEDWLLDEGIVPGNIMSVGSYIAILACVAAGTGFAVIPQSVLDIVSTKGDFKCYPLAGKLSQVKTLMAWRSGYETANLVALNDLLPTGMA